MVKQEQTYLREKKMTTVYFNTWQVFFPLVRKGDLCFSQSLVGFKGALSQFEVISALTNFIELTEISQ